MISDQRRRLTNGRHLGASEKECYTYLLLLDLKVGRNWAVRNRPHPRFYADTTDTVPIAVPALPRTEWWPVRHISGSVSAVPGLSAPNQEAERRPAERNQKKPASSRTDWPCHARSTRGFKLLPEYEKRPCVVARSFGRLMSRPVLAQHRRPLRQRQELSGSVMIRRRNRRGTGPPSIESHLRLFPQLSLALTTPGKFGPWHRRQY